MAGVTAAPRPARRRRRTDGLRWHLMRLAGLAVPLGAWEALSRTGVLHSVFVPPVSRVTIRALSMPAEAPWDYVATVEEIVVAFLLTTAIGVTVGVAIGQSRRLDTLLLPVIWFLYASPVVAFITFLVVLLGIGPGVAISLGVLGSVVFLIVNTRDGVRQIHADLLKVGRVYCAGWRASAVKIILPAATPMIVAGMRIGAGRMLVGVIVGEFFASGGGLGYLIIKHGYALDMEALYASVLWIILVGIALNIGFTRLERRFVTWRSL